MLDRNGKPNFNFRNFWFFTGINRIYGFLRILKNAVCLTCRA